MNIDKKITVNLTYKDMQEAIARFVEGELQDEGLDVYLSPEDVLIVATGNMVATISARVVVNS